MTMSSRFPRCANSSAPRERSLRSQYNGQELIDKVREARQGALQDLIDRQLIIQEFKKKDFSIPQHFIDDRVDEIIREEFGGDRQAFIRTLQAQGYTMTKFRDAERDKIIVQAMRFQNVKSSISSSRRSRSTPSTPPASRIHDARANPPVDDRREQRARPPPGESDPQKRVAQEIRDKLAKGAKFEQLAQLYSNDSSRQTGGDWG